MSLGWNTHRNPRITNLPGAVGGSIIPVQNLGRKRVASPRARVPASIRSDAPSGIGPTRASVMSAASSSSARGATPVATPDPVEDHHAKATASSLPPQLLQAAMEETQWVYADVDGDTGPLVDAETGQVLHAEAPAGARVLLVYPMQPMSGSGGVRMRLKSVHPVTGQLAVRWVIVYDTDTDKRYVSNFSLRA